MTLSAGREWLGQLMQHRPTLSPALLVPNSCTPHLAKMARQYLGCPASSASVERIFSVAGQFFDDLRRKLDDKKLEELMWAAINKGNRRKEYFD